VGAEDNAFPGYTPDCWKEPRAFHKVGGGSEWSDEYPINLSQAELEPEGERIFSLNGAYYFVQNGVRPVVSITIFAEKDHFLDISLADGAYGARVSWINEKLVFARIWWGRIAFDDLVVDVENETILSRNSGTEGRIAYEQFQEGCKINEGCSCVFPE
jgi:hypothetical protein